VNAKVSRQYESDTETIFVMMCSRHDSIDLPISCRSRSEPIVGVLLVAWIQKVGIPPMRVRRVCVTIAPLSESKSPGMRV
jgi:hypothetical protein